MRFMFLVSVLARLTAVPPAEACAEETCRAYWAAIDARACKAAEEIVLRGTGLAFSAKEINQTVDLFDPEVRRRSLARSEFMMQTAPTVFPELFICDMLDKYRDGQSALAERKAETYYADNLNDLFTHRLLREDRSGREQERSFARVIRDFAMGLLADFANCRDHALAYIALADIVAEGKAYPPSLEKVYLLLTLAKQAGAPVDDRLEILRQTLGGARADGIAAQATAWRALEDRKSRCFYVSPTDR